MQKKPKEGRPAYGMAQERLRAPGGMKKGEALASFALVSRLADPVGDQRRWRRLAMKPTAPSPATIMAMRLGSGTGAIWATTRSW